MPNGTGSATLDFGAAPGSNEASVSVTGLSTISGTSKCEAWVMGDSTTTDHTANDHKYFPVFAALTCGTPTASTGFIINARSAQKLTGIWVVQWVWSD